ncbi:hypothetical protein NMY22_g15961 [Coprinellus aureogranulatus]|nr:hypothetical protein NMY22_g15961 [Coprinellus aureogranulatus]
MGATAQTKYQGGMQGRNGAGECEGRGDVDTTVSMKNKRDNALHSEQHPEGGVIHPPSLASIFVDANNAGKGNSAIKLVEAPLSHGSGKGRRGAVVDGHYVYQAGFIGPEALGTLKVVAVTQMRPQPKPKNRKCCEHCNVM